MRVCIVGGGGYLGCQLARRLQSEGAHTVLLDVAFPAHPSIVLDEKLTTRIQGSLLDEAVVCDALTSCESCFHLAAYGMSGLQSFNRYMIYKVNVVGTLRLLEYCRRMKVPRFVFASSVAVIFTGKELVNVNEDYPYPDEREEIIQRGLYVATFSQKPQTLTQYSGVHNVTHAMCQADKELAKLEPRCAGKAYHVVDANPVNSFLFWLPLIKALSRRPPSIRIPFALIYFIAYLSECFAEWFHIPPMLNRLEVNLMGITNTYSIEGAIRDFDYKPTNNHDLTEVVEYYKSFYEENPSTMCFDIRQSLKIVLVVVLFSLFIVRYLFS